MSHFQLERFPCLRLTVLLATCTWLTACATTQAVVYPKGGAATQAKAQRALLQCEQRAQRDVGLNHRHAPVRRTVTAGAAEAAEAMASGWVKGEGQLLREGLAGGVGGVAGALVKSLIERDRPDRVYEKYVEVCMKERGHQVLGWR